MHPKKRRRVSPKSRRGGEKDKDQSSKLFGSTMMDGLSRALRLFKVRILIYTALRREWKLAASTTSHSHHFCALLGPNTVTALTTLSPLHPVSTTLAAPSQLGLLPRALIRSSSLPASCTGHIPMLSYAPSVARVCLWWCGCVPRRPPSPLTSFPLSHCCSCGR
jgi:hypothetical protein